MPDSHLDTVPASRDTCHGTRPPPMADVFSKEKRSEVMSRIRGANTRPERNVRPC
jgi:hypothetical protein